MGSCKVRYIITIRFECLISQSSYLFRAFELSFLQMLVQKESQERIRITHEMSTANYYCLKSPRDVASTANTSATATITAVVLPLDW